MDRTTYQPAFEGLRADAERIVKRGSDLPAFQTRTCAHCGNLTTFVPQDLAGRVRLPRVRPVRLGRRSEIPSRAASA